MVEKHAPMPLKNSPKQEAFSVADVAVGSYLLYVLGSVSPKGH